MTKTLLILIAACGMTFSALAQPAHDHTHANDHSHAGDFASIDDGWLALETVSAEIQAAVKVGDMKALHGLSDKLRAVADGLASQEDAVPQVNRLRYTSSINQIRSLSDRFHAAHESNDVAAAERMVPQLSGMVQMLMVSAER